MFVAGLEAGLSPELTLSSRVVRKLRVRRRRPVHFSGAVCMHLPYALAACVAALVGWSGVVGAGVRIESESAQVDRSAGVVRFTLRFDGRPDFFTVDPLGRVADSFQYEIDGDWRAPMGLPPEGLDAVVRGDEIHAAGALRIRQAGFDAPPDPDPLSGGWGRVLAAVPFNLDGTVLRFEAGLRDIGDDGDGYFAYRVFTTEYGLTTSEVESRLLPPGEEPPPGPVSVPLPPPLQGAVAAAAMIFGMYVVSHRSRIRRAC
jgi:hypothetical protein